MSSIKARRDHRSKNKCITILDLPSELLQKILSRVGLKANIQASAVCKAWCEAAVSVRKPQHRPWLLYPLNNISPFDFRGSNNYDTPTQTYILYDQSRGQRYKQEFPELGRHEFLCYKDGWLLVLKQDYPRALFFLDPFTRERVYLPLKGPRCVAFTAAPTSTSCLVIAVNYAPLMLYIEIMTWRPGETVWTTHCYGNHIHCEWYKCVISNGMFYCVSNSGLVGVFDPPRATWNILPVESYHAFRHVGLVRIRELMMEHEGDVYVISTGSTKNNHRPLVLKLNLKRMVWEDKRELGGLTVFASYPASLTKAGLLAEMNRIYPSQDGNFGACYLFPGAKHNNRTPKCDYLSQRIAWVDPPHNQVNLSPYAPYDGFRL